MDNGENLTPQQSRYFGKTSLTNVITLIPGPGTQVIGNVIVMIILIKDEALCDRCGNLHIISIASRNAIVCNSVKNGDRKVTNTGIDNN